MEFGGMKILVVTFLGWLLAQSIKVMLGVIREKKFNFRWFVGTGGFPSSHVAGAATLATSTGLSAGFDSAPFAVAAVFALVVMFDAQGVRRASGKQAEILNQIIDDIYERHEFKEEKLKELLGHTPVEVFAGALVGILVALLCYS